MTEKELIQTKEPETDTIPNTTIVSSTTKGSNQNTDMTPISTTTTTGCAIKNWTAHI